MAPRGAAAVLLAAVLAMAVPAANGAEVIPRAISQIIPHRALYSMRLGKVRSGSGVIDARGAMEYEWGETCRGWTIQQRYRLRMRYAESADVEIQSNFVTWEAKDGTRYRFNDREMRNGKVTQDIRGTARLDGPGKGGVADFTRPRPHERKLPPGVLFPSAHTILLINAAQEGQHFVVRKVFDGSADEGASEVSAVIGPKLVAAPAAQKLDPLLRRPGWNLRLAFFPADSKAEEPDYELGMKLLNDGVSQAMVIDYGEYAIDATLDDIEPLPKPHC
jgi:hypothetical protein